MKEKLLLIGYRGYGDWLFATPALPYLFDKYDVYLETNMRGGELFHDDPRFKGKTYFDVDELHYSIKNGNPLNEMEEVHKRWDVVEKEVKPDKVINLFRTLESKCISESWQKEYYSSIKERRDIYGDRIWKDQIFNLLGIDKSGKPDIGLYFEEKNIKWADRWKDKYKDQKIVMTALSGSAVNKKYPDMEKLVFHILEKYEDCVIYMVGSEKDSVDWTHKRLYNTCGKSPYKQSILMCKHSDLLIGPETGMHVAAGVYGVPKIQLCSMSNVHQICGTDKNDYSVQSKSPCSPCHKLINTVFQCDNVTVEDYNMIPSCSIEYDWDEIINNVDKVLA